MSDTKTTTGKLEKSEAEWRKELTPMQYAVLREKATERPFSGEYEHEHSKGTYTCAGCGQTLFESDAKFDSGCGRLGEARPAAAGIELGVGFEQGLAAAGAGVSALAVLMLVFAGKRPLGRLLAQHR